MLTMALEESALTVKVLLLHIAIFLILMEQHQEVESSFRQQKKTQSALCKTLPSIPVHPKQVVQSSPTTQT